MPAEDVAPALKPRGYTPQGQRREAILLAAARLFRDKGFDRTTLEDIARDLHVTKPTLYYHLGNKEQILIEILEHGLRHVLEGLEEVLGSDRKAAAILEGVMSRYAEWVTTEFGVCVTRLVGVPISPDYADRVKQPRRLLAEKVVQIIERGIADGSIAPCDPRVAANALFGAFNWLPFWFDEEHATLSPRDLGTEFIRIFLQGLSPRAP